MPPTEVTIATVDDDPSAYEAKHVHDVYERIASHFSATRYKPWPIIARFLSSLPTGWIGLDSGTGNGKYLPLPSDRPGAVHTIGLDRSQNLLKAAQTAGGAPREVVCGDVLGRGWRKGAFDYAISIATIHHLATHERRRAAVERLLECVAPDHGRVLIYVWAIEQDERSKRSIPSAPAIAAGDEIEGGGVQGQDVFVPWVLNNPTLSSNKKSSIPLKQPDEEVGEEVEMPEQSQERRTFERYYHMFGRGELPRLVEDAASSLGITVGSPSSEGTLGLEVVQSGWERSNYYIELRRWQT